LDAQRAQVFSDKMERKQRLMNMRPCEAEKMGINRGTLWRMKRVEN
jgi:hypothetical protein